MRFLSWFLSSKLFVFCFTRQVMRPPYSKLLKISYNQVNAYSSLWLEPWKQCEKKYILCPRFPEWITQYHGGGFKLLSSSVWTAAQWYRGLLQVRLNLLAKKTKRAKIHCRIFPSQQQILHVTFDKFCTSHLTIFSRHNLKCCNCSYFSL